MDHLLFRETGACVPHLYPPFFSSLFFNYSKWKRKTGNFEGEQQLEAKATSHAVQWQLKSSDDIAVIVITNVVVPQTVPCKQRLNFRCVSWCAKSSLCRQLFNFLSCRQEIRHAICKQN